MYDIAYNRLHYTYVCLVYLATCHGADLAAAPRQEPGGHCQGCEDTFHGINWRFAVLPCSGGQKLQTSPLPNLKSKTGGKPAYIILT